MARKIKKATPWFLVATVLMMVLVVSLNVLVKNVNAGLTPTTGVTVGNVVPDNLSGTTDGSSTSSPTSAGSNVTFTATGYDDNGDTWKLLICKTAGTTGTDCDGGAGDRWCVSASAVASGNPNTCTYTTSDSNDYSNAWHAYACDATACSATADTAASPFIVNHAPEFTDSSPDAAKDPGATVTITATAADDARDTSGQVQLYVCKDDDFTGSACGVAGEWAHGSLANSNPTAAFAVPAPDGVYDYYPYIIDTWGMASDGAGQGVLDHFTVNNIAPVVSSVSLNGGSPITITANSSSNISATATISDSNGCTNLLSGNEIASANAVFFQDNLTTEACGADENNCYIIASCSLGSCSSGSLTATCQATMWYNANPTDSGAYATNQTWNADKWTAWVKGIDDDAAEDTETNSAQTIEVTTTTGLNVVEASIAYGNLDPGASSTADNNDDTEVQSVGNAPINSKQYGSTVLTYLTNTIPNENQKLGLTDAVWASLTFTLKDNLGAADEVDLVITTVADPHGSPPSDIIYWGLHIPETQASGVYAGVNTFSAVEEDSF